MRPKLLELEGFTSFRENTRISFEEVALFSLSGPTGAGKSSVIDALIFALYGSVPRYDNRNLVAPAISQGLEEMKVGLTFEVEGKTYTAARVVRRTKQGATTAEARLEMDGRVLAGTADEVTARVTSLLGLGFEHFIKCAVLPQGEFARFLHEPAARRQDLLVELLELQVYQEMSQRAKSRNSRLEDEARAAERILNEVYADVSAQSLEDCEARIRELETLEQAITDLQAPLAEVKAEVFKGEAARVEIGELLKALAAIAPPDQLEDLAHSLEERRAALKQTCHQFTEQNGQLLDTSSKLEALPPRPNLERTLKLSRELGQIGSEVDRLSQERKQEEDAKLELERQLSACQQERDELRGRHQDLLRDHLALGLTRTLEPGVPCPVCDQVVKQVPKKPPPPEVEALEGRLEQAGKERDKLTTRQQRITSRAARIQAQLENLLEQSSNYRTELRDLPPASDAETLLQERMELERVLAELKLRSHELSQLRREHEARIAKLGESEQKAWNSYHLLVGRLQRWGFPASEESQDLLTSWQQLIQWQQERTQGVNQEHESLLQKIDELRARDAAIESEITTLCRRGEIELKSQNPVTACSLALAETRTRFEQMQGALRKSRSLKREVKQKQGDAETAQELSTLLNARNFERWYLNRALQKLVMGASRILLQLTRDQYSLVVDEKSNFEVLDHTNAHQRRPVKTLSGGETFLASLSLALALSEHVAELSVRGAAPLEALVLDEGFGALDDETLDVVACALEELGAGGRMVGIVTHVQELARRMPVRFEISRQAGTSQVERIEN